MTDSDKYSKPRPMRVRCFNALDGCKATVMYMGTKRVRKICPNCLEYGAPSERIAAGYNFSKEVKSRKITARIPDRFYDPSGPIVACTVRMKTLNGGRVFSYPAKGK